VSHNAAEHEAFSADRRHCYHAHRSWRQDLGGDWGQSAKRSAVEERELEVKVLAQTFLSNEVDQQRSENLEICRNPNVI
jgi:hypothetical protein